MGKVRAFYRRYSVWAVATALLLLGGVRWIVDLIGLVDEVRSMMDTNHWFTQILLWPHLAAVISSIGLVILIFLIAKEMTSGKVDTQASAPVATDTTSPLVRLTIHHAEPFRTSKETDKWLVLFREREKLEQQVLQLKASRPAISIKPVIKAGMDEDDVREQEIKRKEQRITELNHMMSADLKRQLRKWHEDP